MDCYDGLGFPLSSLVESVLCVGWNLILIKVVYYTAMYYVVLYIELLSLRLRLIRKTFFTGFL